jgi:hypothetical protein
LLRENAGSRDADRSAIAAQRPEILAEADAAADG